MLLLLPRLIIAIALVLFLLRGFIPIATGFRFSSATSPSSHRQQQRSIRLNGADAPSAAADADDGADTVPPKTIFLMSDGTGATVKSSVQKSLGQFDGRGGAVQTRVFTFVRGEEAAAAVVRAAAERDAMIVSTMADPSLREKTLRMCELSHVPALDLLGPTLDTLSSFLGEDPTGVPMAAVGRRGRSAALTDSYYRRIDAVEFTLRADDGRSPRLLREADVVLVGVSRTGKTPLSVVLSQTMGLRVANVPLVLEVPPPRELTDPEAVDPRRVFCLTIAPSELKRIRKTRLERRGVKAAEEKYDLLREGGAKSNYAERNYVLRDLKNAFELTQRHGWTQIDVTGRAVEETASHISELMNERFDRIFVENWAA